MSTPISVVCFDLGGVLVQICRTWEDACLAAGLQVCSELTSARFKRQWEAVLAEHQTGRCTSAAAFAHLSDATGGRYTPTEIALIFAAWTQDEYVGVDTVVQSLVADPNVSTACLSNTNAAHWERLVDPGENSRYRTVAKLERKFASHLMGLAKPDPEIYEATTAALGVLPQEVLFFDDTEDNVDCARVHGWNSVLIDWRKPTADQIRAGLRRHGFAVD